jgi:RNA polymerase sigma-70 factor (ECF subfamily)
MTTGLPFAHGNSEVEAAEAAPAEAQHDDLVARAKAGDTGAFGQLYLEHFDELYAYFRLALNDTEESEQATQDVFMRALAALPSFDGEQSFQSWLMSIARETVFSRLQKHAATFVQRTKTRRRGSADNDGEQELRALRWISDDDLLLLLDCLPEPQRQALVLNQMCDFSLAEIGEILGKSPRAVRRLQGVALAMIRERLSAVGREGSSPNRLAMTRFRQRRRDPHSVTLRR